MTARRAGEPSRAALAVRGACVLLALCVLAVAAWARTTERVGGPPRLVADVRDAGGSLRPGSDIKIAGVIVGRVDSVERAPDDAEGTVRLGLRIRAEDLRTIPANVRARILPATVFGTSFVDLVVLGRPVEQRLAAGDVVPADTSAPTLELQRALDDIDRLVDALGPAELQSALSAVATALDGRGERLGQLVELTDRYLGRLVPLLPQVRTDLRLLADNLEIVDAVAPDLLQATDDALVTLDTVVAQRASIAAIISGGTTLARDADRFLGATVGDIARFLDDGALLLDALYDNRRAAITDSIAANIRAGREVPLGIQGTAWLRNDAVLRRSAPPYYTAADRPRYGSSARQAPPAGSLRSVLGAGDEEVAR